MVSLSRKEFPEIETLSEAYGRSLKNAGIQLRTVCRCEERVMLLVYREEKLALQLQNAEIDVILTEAGYPEGGTEQKLSHLEKRLSGGDFPHEIGAFLGYPAADIRGFQQNGGRDCKYCGFWKVYSDVESARKSFDRFVRCRDALCMRIRQGKSIEELFCAGTKVMSGIMRRQM